MNPRARALPLVLLTAALAAETCAVTAAGGVWCWGRFGSRDGLDVVVQHLPVRML